MSLGSNNRPANMAAGAATLPIGTIIYPTTRTTSMPMLHDPTVRSSIEARLNAIRADAPRQWGSMTVDQMLWHVNQSLAL